MSIPLKASYITCSKIAKKWNEEGYPRLNGGGKWEPDNISKKLREF